MSLWIWNLREDSARWRMHPRGKGRPEQSVFLPSIWSGPSKLTAVPETLPKLTTELCARGPGPFPEEPSCRDSVLSQDATSNEAERNSWLAFSPSCRPLWALRSTALAVNRTVWPWHSPTASTPTTPTSVSPGLIWLLLGSLPHREVSGARGQWTLLQLVEISGEAAALNPVWPSKGSSSCSLGRVWFPVSKKKTWVLRAFFFFLKALGHKTALMKQHVDEFSINELKTYGLNFPCNPQGLQN